MYYSIWRYGNGGYGCANDFVRSRIKDPASPRLSAMRLQGLLCGRFLCLPRGRLRARSRCQGFAARRPIASRAPFLCFRASGCRGTGSRRLFEIPAAALRHRRGQDAAQGAPCRPRLWADLPVPLGPSPPLRGNGLASPTPGEAARLGPLRPRAFRRKLAYAAFISPSPSDFSQKSPHRLAHRHFPWYRVTRGCSVHTCLPICPLGRKESP